MTHPCSSLIANPEVAVRAVSPDALIRRGKGEAATIGRKLPILHSIRG
jgi:hypothetical protein